MVITSVYSPSYTRGILIGLLVFFIPSQLFAWISFVQVGAVRHLEVVKNFYLAEVIKYVSTLGLFAYSFYLASDTIEANIILITYIAFWLVHQCLLGVLFKTKSLG